MLIRLARLLVRLFLPPGETGDAIAADLDREARALTARRPLWFAEAWRVLQAIQISLHFMPRRLRRMWGGRGPLGDVLGDLRYGVRRLGRAPLATSVAIVVAGLGIGAATATFSVLEAVLLRPLPYPEPHELVQLSETVPDQAGMAFGRGFTDSDVSPLNYLDYADAASFANAAWIAGYSEDVDGLASIGPVGGAVEFVGVISVAPSFFATMGARMALGSTFADDERFRLAIIDDYFMGRVVLSHDLWTRSFASDPAIVGKTVAFEGGRAEVAGVLGEGFEFPPLSERGRVIERNVDVYISQSSWTATFPRDRGVFRTVARLQPGVTVEVAQEELDRIAAGLRETYPEIDDGMRVVITPLHEHFARDYGRALYTLFGMVALVLLVACANLAGLAVAQGIGRDAEMSVRSALGARRGRLLRLLLVESVVVALCGGILGVVLAYAGTDALVELHPVDVARASAVGLDGIVLTFALLTSVVVGVGFGLLPAIQCSGIDVFRALGGRGMTRARRTTARRLVGVQVALTLVLLAGAALLGKSYAQLRGSDLGFESESVLQMSINRGFLDEGFAIGWWDLENRRDRWMATAEIVEGIRSLPGVASVATGDINVARTQVWRVRVEHGDSTRPIDAFVENVSPEYFSVLGIPIVRGRGLAPWNRTDDADRYWWTPDAVDCRLAAKADYAAVPAALRGNERCDGPSVVVSETFARVAWPGEDPIGKAIDMYDCCFTVGGVARDVRTRGVDAPALGSPLDDAPAAVMYVPYTDLGPFLVRAQGDPDQLVEPIRAVVASLRPQWQLSFVTLERRVEDSLARPRLYAIATGLFAGTTLLMALVGLYGLVAHEVGRRVPEIGLRRALGAPDRRLRAMILREALAPVAWGVAIGLIITVAAAGTLERLLYGMEALDPWVVGGVVAAIGVVSVAACAIPASRAIALDPARSLSGL